MKICILFSLLGLLASSVAQAETGSCERCNVLLISMDAVQASHVSHLGNSRPTTPNLDRLAGQGISFSQAISPASWTVPTYLSIFSSTFPSVHGLTNRYEVFTEQEKTVANFERSRPQLRTLASVLRDAGYRTGGFTGDSGVSKILGYGNGFDAYTDEVPFGGFETSARHALDWISQPSDKPFFLFLHGYDSHGQYALPKDYKGRFMKTAVANWHGTREEQGEIREKGLAGTPFALSDSEIEYWREWYDSKIADADERLGKFLAELSAKGLLKNTIVVVLSDHGTEFYEHGRFDHGHTLYDELIHVPLVFVVPGVNGGKKIDAQVSTLDTFPTLIELLKIKPSDTLRKQWVGRSLASALQGKRLEAADAYSETDYRNFTHKRSIRTADGWKYIMTLENGSEELYDLRKDSHEKKNLADTSKSKLKQLRAKLTHHIESELMASGKPLGKTCLPVYAGQCTHK